MFTTLGISAEAVAMARSGQFATGPSWGARLAAVRASMPASLEGAMRGGAPAHLPAPAQAVGGG